MFPFTKANWVSLTGLLLAAVGIALFTQLGTVANAKSSSTLLNGAALLSGTMTLVGLLVASIGSVIWARRTSVRPPLMVAALVGVVSLLLGLIFNINVHGTTGILIFPIRFAIIDVALLLLLPYW